MPTDSKRKLIIDTDIGLDDAQAIIYLAACKDIEILAITLVAGNAQMPIIAKNAKRIMTFLEKESIPIYEMGSYNMMGKYITTDGYFGENGFAGIQLPESNIKTRTDMTSPSALIHYAKQFPGQVDMMFIGPLTNLALAFLLDNNFPSYAGNIKILGGDREEITFKNATKHADFNCWCDPLSFKIVNDCFSALRSPILLIDWYICWNSLLHIESLFQGMFGADGEKKKKNKYLELMHIITEYSNEMVRRNYWDGGFLTADLFAAVAIDDPSIVSGKKRVKLAKVVLEGEKIGLTVFEDDPNGLFEMVTSIDTKKMIHDIVNVLSNA